MLIKIMSIIILIFIVLCLLGILISYFWAKRQKSIYPKTMENIDNYTFYFQTIIDNKGNTSGLEALLRKFDDQKQEWLFPDDINQFTLREVVHLLQKSLINISYPSSFLAINISLMQLSDPRYEYFIRWVKGECYPMELRIEFNVELSDKIGFLMKVRIKKNLKISKKIGVHVILEKVKPDKSYYKKIKWLLKYIYGVKIPLSKFYKKNDAEWFYLNIGDWVRLIKTKNKKIDITEVEDIEGLNLANKLTMDNRQGYFINKPHYEE
ncbi:EAL domain-containing protein [Lactovum miscens]|uniref:EAL domain-containing protein (Putative c-di-GMP-specific phosphodiesterase class I) n=1 Tax=Lactovum miscens TaxID=190387 RepID=A0A841CAH9_9LACT|nr:EAL domain-containing protein [Lactovum miscens]MBB5888399.1 EAL domain-containing protein (putative c-di-GMP-specific phosphodiesterase class I) [Lactovum miscens]